MVHVALHTISDTSGFPVTTSAGLERGDQMCEWTKKMDQMTSVTGQGNNRVVYTNNKTVTLFLFHTFILTFLSFPFLKKKNYCTELNLCIIPLFNYEMIEKRKRGRGEKKKSNKSLKPPDCTEKIELKT